jgi:hypothetical protein
VSGRTVRYAVVVRPEGTESVEAAHFFGPFFAQAQADAEAMRWNRANEVVGWFATVEPMGGLDALRRWTPDGAP